MKPNNPSKSIAGKDLLAAKAPGKSQLLDEVRDAIRVRHYSIRTEHRVKIE